MVIYKLTLPLCGESDTQCESCTRKYARCFGVVAVRMYTWWQVRVESVGIDNSDMKALKMRAAKASP